MPYLTSRRLTTKEVERRRVTCTGSWRSSGSANGGTGCTPHREDLVG